VIEAGVQLHLPSYRHQTLHDLLAIADAAGSGGFAQIWVSDNLECRDTFVVMAALAGRVTVKLGTAIMGQYFRSPVRSANSLIPVAELMAGRELVVGVGAGNPMTGRLIEMPRPVGFMRQSVTCLRRLLNGEEVPMIDYPLVAEYFRFRPDSVLEAPSLERLPISIYGGGNGPRGLALAGEVMDGLLFGWTTLHHARIGTLADKIAIADAAAARSGRLDGFRRVMELKVSIAKRHEDARQFVRTNPSCARRTLGLRRRGYTDDDFRALGIDPIDIDRLETRLATQGPFGDFGEFVTDSMIDASYIAGDPSYCAERIAEVVELCVEHGFGQVIFSELGPDQVDAVRLLSDTVLPVLAAGSVVHL
jgi:alkanesulfonate monooxygenase SsuD/methylene tetrahydromethanopterin reductase-like flavin-dependent oxidoreductase (luciferase family)